MMGLTPVATFIIGGVIVTITIIAVVMRLLYLDNITYINRLKEISKDREYVIDVYNHFYLRDDDLLKDILIKVDEVNKTIVIFNTKKNKVIGILDLDEFYDFDRAKEEENRIKKLFN